MSTSPYPLRTIKSWMNRQHGLSSKQETMLQRERGMKYFVHEDLKTFISLLPADKTIFLDIGFGQGESLIALAELYPDALVIGVEPYLAGVVHCLQNIERLNLKNCLLYQGDVLDYLEASAAVSLQRVHVYFSDPWPKTKHHKRRLIQATFLDLLAKRMPSQGILHIATDWEHYAEHIKNVIREQKNFMLHPHLPGFQRPLTRYEKRGLSKGHLTYEFYLQRV